MLLIKLIEYIHSKRFELNWFIMSLKGQFI